MFDPQTVHGPLANATIGRIFKPRVLYRPELVPESLGGTASREELRQINLAMKAGLDERGLGLIVGGSGGGGGFPGNSSGLSAPGVLGGGGGPGGGIGQITAAGRIVVHSLPMTMDEEGYETLGKSSIQRPGWGARLSQNEIAQQNRMTKAGVGGLIKARPTDLTRLASQTTPFSEDDLDMISMESGTIQALSNATDIAGLYGFFGRTALEMAGIPLEQPGLVLQDPGRAYGFARRWYDASLGGLGGSVNEAGRRFLTRPDRNETWNPIYNTAMPSWLPGSNYFLDLRHGDIHQKIQRGELRLPGAAWESVNPQARFMWSRASSLGQSVEEHMRDMLFLDEPMSAAGERITELGSKVHSKIQAQWKKMGVLIRAEQTITNEELGISGHFDALLRTSTGEQIFEIKTVSGRRFEQASRQPFLEHLTQTNFYLHEMGLRRGNLIYVNRDDPDQIRTHRVLYDPKLYEESIGRVQEARARLGGMIDAGLISKYETLDPVSRFEILGDVASYSAEYAQVRQYLTEKNKDGQLSEAENDRFQAVKKRAAKTKKRVETFGYRFADVDLQYETVTVDQILDPNTFTIRGSENPIRLAGVRSSQDRIQDQWGAAPDGMSEAEWQFAQLGIRKGSRVRVAVEGDDKFHIADDVLKTRHAVVFARGRNVNRRLLDLGVGEEKETDFSSTGVAARFSPWEIFKGAVWERFAHANTALHTKFLRVRSPLEQLERGIVYGKDTGGWQHPVQDYLIPTIESYAAKNPVVGGALLGAFATFFVESRAVKWQAFKAGAAVGAGLSLLRMGWEATHEGPWKPVRTRRREELEEYWDTLKYLKFRRLAAQEERLAKELEGIDVDLMEREAWRQGESRSKKKNILEDYKRRLKKGDRKFDREMRELRERRAAARERRPGETEGERRARARELREEMHRLRAIRGGGPEAEAARDVQVDLIQAQLNQADEREEAVRLGPHAAKALQYRDLYRSTLHGFDPDKTPFLNLFRALPKYKRELIEPFINKSNQQEREKIFSLLPRAEQRVLGRYLGIEADRIPERPRLGEFFKDHPLPGPDWQGWEESTNLEELRQIAVKKEGLDPFESAIYPQQIEEAERRHEGVPIPTLQGRSPDIQQRLNEILSGKGLNHVRVEVAVQPRPDDGDHVQVQMQLRQRRERDILEHLQLAG